MFVVAEDIFERHPTYIVGGVLARGVDNARAYPDIGRLLADAEALVREHIAGADPKDVSAIAAWRRAFGDNGWPPSKYPASVEALVKRVAKGTSLPRINPIVDLGNVAVLRCLVPVGAHDLAQLAGGPLTVRTARDGDAFRPMGDAPPEAPEPGEIVYASGAAVRTRRWVWRQAADALVTSATRDVFFPIDGFVGVTDDNVRAATQLLSDACRDILRADVRVGLVTKDAREFT